MTRLSLFSVVLLLVFASQLISLKCVAEGATTTNGPYLLDFDIHYQIDKVGSYNENPYE